MGLARWRKDGNKHSCGFAINCERRVRRSILESALVKVPMVVGWLRPVILLPASALTGLSQQQLEAIIAHELAHIRRHDYDQSVAGGGRSLALLSPRGLVGLATDSSGAGTLL